MLALMGEASAAEAHAELLGWQSQDGSWPAFVGDTAGSWTTALALLTLHVFGDESNASERALRWLIRVRGRESHWLWRWKFKSADRQVRFDPEKFGWPWLPGTNSWVIPTSLAVNALKQTSPCAQNVRVRQRIRVGVEMLYDRACLGGGWNAGNPVVQGVELVPNIEATAAALMALQDEPRTIIIRQSLEWLKIQAAGLQSISSLGWSILSLSLYQEPIDRLKTRLSITLGEPSLVQNNATLALAVLALQCGEVAHPFAVMS